MGPLRSMAARSLCLLAVCIAAQATGADGYSWSWSSGGRSGGSAWRGADDDAAQRGVAAAAAVPPPLATTNPWLQKRRGSNNDDAGDSGACFEEDCRSSPFIMHASRTLNTTDGGRASCFKFVAIGCYAAPKGCCPNVARRFTALAFDVSECPLLFFSSSCNSLLPSLSLSWDCCAAQPPPANQPSLASLLSNTRAPSQQKHPQQHQTPSATPTRSLA